MMLIVSNQYACVAYRSAHRWIYRGCMVFMIVIIVFRS